MNRSHIKITNNFLLVFPPNKTQNLSEIRVSQNLVNLMGGGIELEKIVQLVRGGGGVTLALIFIYHPVGWSKFEHSAPSLTRIFWDLNGVGVVKEG